MSEKIEHTAGPRKHKFGGQIIVEDLPDYCNCLVEFPSWNELTVEERTDAIGITTYLLSPRPLLNAKSKTAPVT